MLVLPTTAPPRSACTVTMPSASAAAENRPVAASMVPMPALSSLRAKVTSSGSATL